MVKRRRIISAREPLGSLARYGNIYIKTKIMGKRILISEEERNHITQLHNRVLVEDERRNDKDKLKSVESSNIQKLNTKVVGVLDKFILSTIDGLSTELSTADDESKTHGVGAKLIKVILRLNMVLSHSLTLLEFNTLDFNDNVDAKSYYNRILSPKPDIEHMLNNIRKLFKSISNNKRTNNTTKEKLIQIRSGIKTLVELTKKVNKQFIAYFGDPEGKKIKDLDDLFRRYNESSKKDSGPSLSLGEQRVSRDKKNKQEKSEEPKPVIHTTYDNFNNGNVGDYYKFSGSREAARKQHPELQNSTKYPLIQLEDGSYAFKKAQ